MELSGERSFISGASLNISATWNGPASEICRTYWLKSQKGSLGAGWVPRQRTSLRNSELIDSHKRLIICTWIYGGVKILPKYLIYLWRLTWWSTRSSRTFPAVSTLMSEWTQNMCLRSGSALASEGYLTDFTLLHSHKWELRYLWIVASLRACERATFYSVHLNDTSKRLQASQVCRARSLFNCSTSSSVLSCHLSLPPSGGIHFAKILVQRDYCKLCGEEGLWMGQLDFLWPQRLKAEEMQPFVLKSHPIGPSERRHQWLESSVGRLQPINTETDDQ